MTALWIAVAGALGSLCRYAVGVWVTRWTATSPVPWGTLTVNVVGSLLTGFAMAVFAARGQLDSRVRLGLTVGFLGGFTTYSAFAYETVALIEQRQSAIAAGYVALTLASAGAGCALGIGLARLLVD